MLEEQLVIQQRLLEERAMLQEQLRRIQQAPLQERQDQSGTCVTRRPLV